MKTLLNAQNRRDFVKLLFLAAAVIATIAVFVATPALSTPTLLSVFIAMLLSPAVAALERQGLNRTASILLIFAAIGIILAGFGVWVARSGEREWSSFSEKTPQYLQNVYLKLSGLESDLKARYPLLNSVHPTQSLREWTSGSGHWFAENGPSLVGSLLSWALIVPFISFVMLKDGRTIRKRFFQLVPNRAFESFFLMTNEITTALSDYLSAKLLEAGLVGLMTGIGLAVVGAPYAGVLGVVAGITNIIPYIGPVIGAVPGILVALFDSANFAHGAGFGPVLPVLLVYVIANLIDTIVIFPVIVAKLVDLHPLLLVAVVAVGQRYYGLVGMLISIPVATACKVVITEIYSAIYEKRGPRSSELTHPSVPPG